MLLPSFSNNKVTVSAAIQNLRVNTAGNMLFHSLLLFFNEVKSTENLMIIIFI